MRLLHLCRHLESKLALLNGGAVVEVLHARERRRAGLGTQGGAEKTRTQGGVRVGVRPTPLGKCM